jgi:hypothetical protein
MLKQKQNRAKRKVFDTLYLIARPGRCIKGQLKSGQLFFDEQQEQEELCPFAPPDGFGCPPAKVENFFSNDVFEQKGQDGFSPLRMSDSNSFKHLLHLNSNIGINQLR